MREYKDLTYNEIKELNKDKTVFLMALSPLETHGPHLPVGTDLIISEKLLKRYNNELSEKYPNYNFIKLPSLALGSSLLPVDGSIEIKARNLEKILFDISLNLNNLGFKYLFLADNHGGPTHQMAIEAASHKIYKKHEFHLIDPFNYFFKMMVKNDEKLLNKLNSQSGEIGDDSDLHAGNNETSLMLYLSPDNVKEYQNLKKYYVVQYKGLSKFIKSLGELFNSKGLMHLAVNLAWISNKEINPYLGAPAEANAKRGAEMVEARVNLEVKYFDKVLKGDRIEEKPFLWKLRFLRYFF